LKTEFYGIIAAIAWSLAFSLSAYHAEGLEAAALIFLVNIAVCCFVIIIVKEGNWNSKDKNAN
jgi:uncharacterized membrane protein